MVKYDQINKQRYCVGRQKGSVLRKRETFDDSPGNKKLAIAQMKPKNKIIQTWLLVIWPPAVWNHATMGWKTQTPPNPLI